VGAKEPADRKLADMNDRVAAMYTGAAAYYQSYLADRLRAETPDKAFDESLRWAEVAIDQARVALHSETGLGAGFYTSGDAYRPGFGWFFGRDAEWTSYAINSYGDFALTRETLAFLIRRQRDDGKMIHEFSQTADLVDWKSRPYFYASADATPLFVMAMEDYVNTSGDVAFLRKNWEAVRRAYEFTRTHDSDDDGIYDNSEGTGWVEDWKPDLPHQEIYLAALDEQSADATSRLASLMDDGALVAAARERAGLIRTRMEAEYYDPQARFYAFSRNKDGTLDRTATIFPAVAWWSGRLALAQPAAMFGRWASSEFSTDWGTRDISPQTQFYDPISYHEGSVWPLYTGWVSLAEYRTGRTLSAYAHLMQNADLTWAQDLGAVTELLSGAFYQTFGRSSSHQTWSSAMVLTPALRGLFGLDWDALHRTLRLAPHLPAAWNSARLVNVRLGESRLDIEYRRVGKQLNMTARSATPEVLCLVKGDAPRDRPCAASPSTTHQLSIDLPPVELGIPHGLPLAGSETTGLKVTSESVSPDRAEFKLEAPAGSRYELPLRIHRSGLRISGGEVAGDKLVVRFPAGSGRQTVAIEAETLP
jgi:glycogen debranching enzyme